MYIYTVFSKSFVLIKILFEHLKCEFDFSFVEIMSQRKRSAEKTQRKSSLPIDFNNLNFDILNPDHLSKIQGPDYDGYTDVGDSLRC